MEIALKKKQYANSLWIIILPFVVFVALGAFIAIERAGISVDPGAISKGGSFLPKELLVPRSAHKPDKECLFICNSTEDETFPSVENMLFVLDQMSVGYTYLDLATATSLPPLNNYKTIVVACSELKFVMLSIESVFNWVNQGGGLLFAFTPEDELLTRFFYKEMGVQQGVYDYVPQLTAVLETDLLAGGKGSHVPWCDEENSDDYRYGYNFILDDSSIVHMTSLGPQGSTPMLWEHKTGNGRVVVNNNDAMGEMWSRGLVAVAYSLTKPAMAYPVINASLFFIDDFPAPVPEGYNDFIKKDYGVKTEYFFVNIWFPDMLRMAKKHHIKYTSVFVESYNDDVTPPYPPTPQSVTERMKYFGSLYLNEGFEIGLHGYNHQSLVFQDFDYKDELPYNKWPNDSDVVMALNEAERSEHQLFPGNVMRTYVPPSNVLSPECRAVLVKNFPDINVISDLLIDDIFNLRSDFGVADDGIINIPRISSGYDPFDADNDEQPFWAMLNEINLHFVNSHFIHPDDMMDEERGALKGWRNLIKSFDTYLTWLDQFPIRNMTTQEAAPWVQRFDSLTVHTTLSPKKISLDFDGFFDAAWLFVRVNEGVPSSTIGGELTHISENLYLLKASAANVIINLQQEDA